MVRVRKSKLSRTLKDYLVPLVGFVFIILVFINFMSSSNDNIKISNENTVGISMTNEDAITESYIIYPGDSKKRIEGDAKLYKGEKVLVKDGSVSMLLLPNIDLVLNKLGELKYTDNGILNLFSSDLWINTKSKIDIDMRYAKVSISENTVASLSQNEVGSTIYLLTGRAEIQNLSGKSTMLKGGEKITIFRKDASNNDIDLSIKKDNIDNFFKSSDWFIKNSGNLYFKKEQTEKVVLGTGNIISTINNLDLISITSFKDESIASSSSIDVLGKYIDPNISIITINGKITKINGEAKSFSYKGFNLENSVNDIIIKVYNIDRNLLGKKVYTLYLGKNKSNVSNNSGFKVKTFSLDASGFKFTSPSTSGEYITYATFVTIKGIVPKGLVSKVVVNDYKLNSFNGVSWRYHARTSYNNLKKGTNIYEIKYYKKDGSLLYKNNYIIIKKVKGQKKKIISDEAKIN